MASFVNWPVIRDHPLSLHLTQQSKSPPMSFLMVLKMLKAIFPQSLQYVRFLAGSGQS